MDGDFVVVKMGGKGLACEWLVVFSLSTYRCWRMSRALLFEVSAVI